MYVWLLSHNNVPILVDRDIAEKIEGKFLYFERYAQISLNGPIASTVTLHSYVLPVSEGKEVDHRNRDTTDCTRENLRECTRQQNARAKGIRRTQKSKYKGVHIHRGRWVAAIYIPKRLWLGSYATQEEAARVYDEAAKKYFGEFARLNFS